MERSNLPLRGASASFKDLQLLGPDFWTRYLAIYDVLTRLPAYNELLDDIVRECEAGPGSLILDAGSGTGNLAVKLESSGGQVVAVDYCREALLIHRGKHRYCTRMLSDLRGNLPLRGGAFDVVACSNALYALRESEQERLLGEFYRVLKPGGKLVLANPRAGLSIREVGSMVVRHGIRAEGPWRTAGKLALLLPRMVRMAYYNRKIMSEAAFHPMGLDEQRELLEHVGFSRVSETRLSYAGQALLNSAYKP